MIKEIAKLIEENYVFPDIGEEISEYILKRNQEKAYTDIGNLKEFIRTINKDLQVINNDGHLGLVERRGSPQSGVSQEEMIKQFFLKQSYFQNFGFKKVDRLAGNIGYLVLDEFSYLKIDGENVGEETAKAVMKVISNTYGLIIDLRDNIGGREEMAMLLLDYLFENPTHILTNLNKEGNDKQIWTTSDHQEGHLSEIPIFVLTSQHTVSGGEMFAYVLKNRKRAMVIGEKTRGAAHKTHLFSLQSFGIDLAIPLSTTIDPVTGTDWEGKGVEPDIAVSSGKAMNVAYKMALEEIKQGNIDEIALNEINWALMEVDANIYPILLDEPTIREYIGVFEDRKFFVSNGVLSYQKMDQPVFELAPMSKDLFSFVDLGMFYVRIKFGRDRFGEIDKMFMIYDNGKEMKYLKTMDNDKSVK